MFWPRTLTDPERLAVLRGREILDTPREPAYDDIAMLAASGCRSAIAAVNFVDAQRHWTKAIVGCDAGGASVAADQSLCAATICTEGGLLSVSDMTADERWRSHPFVTGAPHLRFYAGAAIVVARQPIGVVCIFGDEPRPISDDDERVLVALAGQAAAHLELRERNLELRELSVTDALTGLPNRRLLLDRLELALARRRRDGGEVGILFCDVDGFKRVNDELGHEAGDRLLREVADGLRRATRESDTIARFGGDEFVVLCPDLHGQAELDGVVERVVDAVHGARAERISGVRPRLSIGAVLSDGDESAGALLGRADAAMYAAKRPARVGG